MMKLLYTLPLVLVCAGMTTAQVTGNFWSDKPESDMRRAQDREIFPDTYRTLGLDIDALRATLAGAPREASTPPTESELVIAFPRPDDGIDRFRIVEYRMMQPELQTRFPEIRTYRGVSVDNPFKTVRFSWTVRGLSVMVSDPTGKYFVDPYARRNQEDYISYFKSDYHGAGAAFECQVEKIRNNLPEDPQQRVSGDCIFRSYRLAVAATGEYSNFHDAFSPADEDTVLSAIVIAIDRVNEVYERDVTIRLTLIAQTTDVFYYVGDDDPYSGSACNQLSQNQSTMDDVIGSANYDIGHVFSVGSGGCASLGVPCTSSKARGATGLNPPIGDPFYIDYVAHEIGHQFGGNHCFNNSCSNNRNNATAYEPGSGATIMAYAGICSPNVQSNSDDYFHGISVQEINNYTANGNGDNCDLPVTGWNNTAPVVSPGADYTIPASTPFMLIANATDADGDPLTYLWEQWDQEIATMPPQSTSTTGPLFRSFDPNPDSIRYFPRLVDLVNNISPTWEVLPSVTRNMDFRITVKDFHNGMAGCADEDNVDISSTDAAGPFLVTSPDTGTEVWSELTDYTVSWDVANTNIAPVNCTQVDIILSYDGGLTWLDTLANGVPNSGSAMITVPVGVTTTARIMVKGHDNIFFDISNQDFEIVTGVPDYTLAATIPDPTICQPDDAVYTIEVGSIAGYSDPVTLSVSGVPSGTSTTFSMNPVVPGNSTTLSISGTGSLSLGDYLMTVQGTSSSGPKNLQVSFTLIDIPDQVTLNSPANLATDISILPLLQWNAVTGAGNYNVEIATDPGVTSIVTSANVTQTSFSPGSSLDPLTTYYWRVRALNSCGTGEWSIIWEFETRPCLIYTSSDVPYDIPPSNGPNGSVSSSLEILDSGTITDLNVVQLYGTHTWVEDLDVYLRSPGATSVELFTDICGSNDNFDLGLDDEAASTIPCPPTSSQLHQPEGLLSDFDGQEVNGIWTLEVFDDYPQTDDGVLQGWAIEVCMTDYSCNKTVFNTNDDGPGSLRDAIACAENGDTITFDASVNNSQILLNSTIALINDIVLITDPGSQVSVSGAGIERAFEISGMANTEIHGLTIIAGSSATGAGILNNGSLLLKDVSIDGSVTPVVTVIENNGALTLEGNCQVNQ